MKKFSMTFCLITAIVITFAASAHSTSRRQSRTVAINDDTTVIDFAAAFDDYVAIVSAEVASDSAAAAEFEEELAQDFSSLFEDEIDYAFADGIDTEFAWNNHRINTNMRERFDYTKLTPEDTIRIALVDSAAGRFYRHPHPGRVTSPFGPRRFLWHYGIDTKLNVGDSVLNAFDGIVRVIQYERRGYGHVVVVRHHNGLETLYAHLHRVTVQPNQRIKAGEMVGLGGNTGRSTGPHLHFEIRYYGEPFNPAHIIDFANHRLRSDTLVLTRANFEYLTVQRQRVVHTVRRGETLSHIARRYGTTVSNLCRLNGITPRTTLRVGQRLIVRQGTPPAPPPSQQVASASPPPPPPEIPSETGDEVDDVEDDIETTQAEQQSVEQGAEQDVLEKSSGGGAVEVMSDGDVGDAVETSRGEEVSDGRLVAATPAPDKQ